MPGRIKIVFRIYPASRILQIVMADADAKNGEHGIARTFERKMCGIFFIFSCLQKGLS